MSKPFFFTGRKEVSASDVSFQLIEKPGVRTRFVARFSLAGLRLPGTARIIVEAYHSSYLERFDAGTVGDFRGGFEREMRDLEPGDMPSFRLKVISNADGSKGRLLASRDQISPELDAEAAFAGSLLTVVRRTREQMGDEFWKLEFEPGDEIRPVLHLNSAVPGLFLSFQNQDPKVMALIMPEILRQVLRGVTEDLLEWTEEGCVGQWLAFARELHGEEFEEWDEDNIELSKQQRQVWIDEVVRRFASKHRFFEAYREAIGSDGAEPNK